MIQTIAPSDRPLPPRDVPPSTREGANTEREPPSPPRGRLPFVDGLRGLAMLMVLACHSWVHTINAPIPVRVGHWYIDVTGPLHYGYLGVHLFLVLSGFCLTYPLARHGAAAMRLDLRRFFHRRAWRILPPYYVALFAFALLPTMKRILLTGLSHPQEAGLQMTAGKIISHILMFHNFSREWLCAINGSFWSLALEWQLYLVFPLLVWGFRRWGPMRTLAATLALTLTYRTWVYATQNLSQQGFLAYELPGRLFEFVLGMTAALALAGMRGAPPRHWVRRYQKGAVGFGILGLCVSAGWSPYSPITDVIWGVTFFCLVMYAGGRSAAGGGWLDARPLVALGLISYSVYLTHEPLIKNGYQILHALHLSPAAILMLCELGVAPLLIGVGWLFFRTVEVRFIGAPARLPVAGLRLTASGASDREPIIRGSQA